MYKMYVLCIMLSFLLCACVGAETSQETTTTTPIPTDITPTPLATPVITPMQTSTPILERKILEVSPAQFIELFNEYMQERDNSLRASTLVYESKNEVVYRYVSEINEYYTLKMNTDQNCEKLYNILLDGVSVDKDKDLEINITDLLLAAVRSTHVSIENKEVIKIVDAIVSGEMYTIYNGVSYICAIQTLRLNSLSFSAGPLK